MSEHSLGPAELRFAELVWAHAPVASGELVSLANSVFSWKKSTTHTVLRRLCDKGLFVNSGGTVQALLTKEDYFSRESCDFVASNFAGSLPAFLAAFTREHSLTEEQCKSLQALIDEARRKP